MVSKENQSTVNTDLPRKGKAGSKSWVRGSTAPSVGRSRSKAYLILVKRSEHLVTMITVVQGCGAGDKVTQGHNTNLSLGSQCKSNSISGSSLPPSLLMRAWEQGYTGHVHAREELLT